MTKDSLAPWPLAAARSSAPAARSAWSRSWRPAGRPAAGSAPPRVCRSLSTSFTKPPKVCVHTAARIVEGREHHPHQALHYVMPSCHHLGCPLDVVTHWRDTVLSRLCSSTNALAARIMPTEVHGTQTQRHQRYGRCIVTMDHVRDVGSQLTKKKICTAAVRRAAPDHFCTAAVYR